MQAESPLTEAKGEAAGAARERKGLLKKETRGRERNILIYSYCEKRGCCVSAESERMLTEHIASAASMAEIEEREGEKESFCAQTTRSIVEMCSSREGG